MTTGAGQAADAGAAARPPGSVRSLRASLARSLLLPILCVLPLAAYLQYSLVLKPTIQAFDHGLGDAALALGNLIRTDEAGLLHFDVNAQTAQALHANQADRMVYAVLRPDGHLLAGDAALAALSINTPGDGSQSFRDRRLPMGQVRVASMVVPCANASCEVRVAETMKKRRAARLDAFVAVLIPMALLAAVLLVVVLVGIRRGLQPLEALRAELSERSLERLDPVSDLSAVAEVRPLIGAVNRLFERLQRASELQKSFLAAAAHQLRTPLTSLRTEAELALLEPHPPTLTPTLNRLAHASERAARLASQLLSQARAESSQTEPKVDTDLKPIAAAEAEEWVRQASLRGADLGFELAPAPLLGRPMMLREMIGNLVHNAFEYAGPDARVTVRTRQDGEGHSLIEVEDNGPGIAPDQRAAVLERFHRGPKATGNGSGLGLSIVRDIVLDHGGDISLQYASPPDGTGRPGLLVRLRFPALAAQPDRA